MSFRERLVQVALDEWAFFDRDLEGQVPKVEVKGPSGNRSLVHKERAQPYCDRIAIYWLAIPKNQYQKLSQDHAGGGRLDGTTKLAWSAAFISFCMKKAGADAEFPYSSGHVAWIRKAIKNRVAEKTAAPIVGYRFGEKTLQAGDLIGCWRTNELTYEQAGSKTWYESHTDLVVSVDRQKREALVIGGNVSQSVARKSIWLTADGRPVPASPWVVHIVNNIKGNDAIAALDEATLFDLV